MADTSGVAKTIDQLPEKASIVSTDMIPIDDGTQSYKVLWGTLLSLTGGIKEVSTTENTTTITLQDDSTIEITQSDPDKQDKLTWDEEPTLGSTNAISSGAVYAAVKANTDAIESEAKTARAAEETNANAISASNEAIAACEETIVTNTKAITAEAETARAAEEANASAIASNTKAITTNTEAIATILNQQNRIVFNLDSDDGGLNIIIYEEEA